MKKLMLNMKLAFKEKLKTKLRKEKKMSIKRLKRRS